MCSFFGLIFLIKIQKKTEDSRTTVEALNRFSFIDLFSAHISGICVKGRLMLNRCSSGQNELGLYLLSLGSRQDSCE